MARVAEVATLSMLRTSDPGGTQALESLRLHGEGHHAPGDLTAPKAVVRLVDLLQRVTAGDHLLHLQLAGQRHLDEAVEVQPGPCRAVPGAEQPRLLLHEQQRVE